MRLAESEGISGHWTQLPCIHWVQDMLAVERMDTSECMLLTSRISISFTRWKERGREN